MDRLSWAAAVGLAILAGTAQADPPAEMDPLNIYAVNAQAGSWMILAASYTGETGKDLARQLLVEVRNRHHLPAYAWNFSDPERRRQQQEEQERVRRLAAQGLPTKERVIDIKDHWGVLIGGYRDLNSASAALPTIRTLPMPELKAPTGRIPFETQYFTEPTPDGRGVVKRAMISPFLGAMAVPNPTIPHENARKKYDPFWEQLNEGESYSLLHCRKPYTYAVKEYVGASMVQPASGKGGLMDGLSWLSGTSTWAPRWCSRLRARAV
jgi:hypothetical protein